MAVMMSAWCLRGGAEVAVDGVPVAGAVSGRSRPDLLLGFRRSQVALGLVGGGRDPQVCQEAQDVGLAVLQAFQQHAAVRLLRLRARDPADLRQADEDGVPDSYAPRRWQYVALFLLRGCKTQFCAVTAITADFCMPLRQ